MKSLLLLCLAALTLISCQKKPGLAPAADNLSSLEPPPMGANLYNDQLKRQLVLLEDLLDNRLDINQVQRVKSALISGNLSAIAQDETSDEAHLKKIFLDLPELIQDNGKITHDKQWLTAKLYFLNRRFIEASMLMSEILKRKDDDTVRNWRARSIFFLGNPDMAVQELNMIVKKNGPKSMAGLDALYLVGAICFESNDMDEKRLKAGISAWEIYLAHTAKDNAVNKEVTEGIAELKKRLRGDTAEKNIASNDPFSPQKTYSKDKNAIMLAFGKKELLLALDLCESFLKTKADVEVLIIKARIFFQTGRLDEATKLFDDIAKKYPNHAPVFHYRGMVFIAQGHPKEAITSWQTAMRLDKTYAQSHGLEQRIAVAQTMVAPKKIETH